MERQSQQYILNIAFTGAINREELLLKNMNIITKLQKIKN